MRFSEANYDTEVGFSLLSRPDRCRYGSSNVDDIAKQRVHTGKQE